MARSRKRRPPRGGVAPADLIQEDFAALKSRIVLRTNLDVEDLLLIQSIEGHAYDTGTPQAYAHTFAALSGLGG